MIRRKHQEIVFSSFMALRMSCIMSLVISIFNVGSVGDILHVWLKAWTFAFVVAFPIITVVAPWVNQLVHLVLEEESPEIQIFSEVRL